MSTVKFIPNIELVQKYKTIQLKPRKYDDQILKYSNKDSILPYFKIRFYNQNASHEQIDDYNKNKIIDKKSDQQTIIEQMGVNIQSPDLKKNGLLGPIIIYIINY